MSVNVGQAVAYLDLDTSGFQKGLKTSLNDLRVFRDSSASASDKLAGLSSAMKSTGSTLTKTLTLPLAGVGAAFVKTSTDFEAAMSEVQAISGATGEQLVLLTEKAKEMGAKTKFSASESAEALKYMAMAGWDTTSMLNGLEGIMNLAAASGEELGTVSDIVTDALTAFGLQAQDSAHFADILARASSRSNTNVSLMGETFKYVAPVAGSLGYTVEDTAVAIGLMANSGIKASQAGTALRGALTRLAKPTKESSEAMEVLGLSITNADGTMKPFIQLMSEMKSSFSGLTEAEKAQYAAMLGGQNAMSGLLAIVNSSDEDFAKLTKEIYNAEGASQEMADVMMDNLQGQLTILKSTLEGIAISFGDLLLPKIKSVVEWLQNLANWLNGLDEETKKTVTNIALFVAALGPVLLIGSKLITSFMGIKNALSLVGGGITSTGGLLTALTGPIGIVIAAVAALAIAWKTDLGNIREHTAELFTKLQELFSSGMAAIRTIWEGDFLGIKTFTQTLWTTIGDIFDTGLTLIGDFFDVWIAIFKGDWEGAWEAIKQTFSDIIEGIKTIFSDAMEFISGVVERVKQKLAEIAAARAAALAEAGVGVDGSHANGLAYVPFNGYIAELHQGERVLTKQEAQEYNRGKGGGTFNFTFNSPSEMSPAEVRRQSVKAMNEILFSM